MDELKLKSIITEAIRETHSCPFQSNLESEGITPHQHTEHHKTMSGVERMTSSLWSKAGWLIIAAIIIFLMKIFGSGFTEYLKSVGAGGMMIGSLWRKNDSL